ncbi:M12 family metallo-peptidase [Flavobacterium aciduliphilum]|uniref:Putative secreted protein (Por secretion system target) n=1 Tax=Flavobacterium aciduliphilum TaxID=1101402 RepID=A0A328YF40_9FLAO|nr:M12 family metallo-peptidase [Flavobacterium aciduliphilum]RAR72618.1 putative secreted protein (Por secretion system target) [Flavobacterium aciduliphilum]
MKKMASIIGFFCVFTLFSQNEVAQKVLDLQQQQKVFFRPYTPLHESANLVDSSVKKVVDNATGATIDKNIVNDVVTNRYDYLQLAIPYNGSTVLLDLYQVNLFAEGFQIDTDKQKNIPYQKGVYYRGIVNGDYTSIASINFFKDEMNGVISNDEFTNLVISKSSKKGTTNDYIIYSDAKLKVANMFTCDYEDKESVPVTPILNKSVTSTRCVTMYFEIDYDLFQQNNSNTTTTTNWMTSLFNNVQTIYANDGISVALKSMYIWTTQDPYEGVGTSSTDYLYKFNEVRPVFNGDVGQLVGIDPGGLGGVAVGINGLCSQNNFSYSDLNSTTVVPFTTYSWEVEVVTHEFGHLLGSPHTHACVWNGNNTAIDNCAPYAMGSSAEGYSCMTNPATLPSSTTKGTIMSYCHLVSNVGIKLTNGFGTQPKNRILSAVNGGTCLSTDCVNTCINTISEVSVDNVTTTTAVINWVESGTFTTWQIAVYPFGTTASNWISVTSTTYTVSNLLPDTYYVVQVRPDCTSGLISGGRTMMFVTAADFCSGIVFTDSGGISANYSDSETVVRTIIPNVPNNAISISFSEFEFEQDYDFLYIYDGNSTAATDITFGGLTGPDLPGTYTSSAPDGSLTVKYVSDQYLNYLGFVATISCIPNLSVNDHSGYIDFSYQPNPTKGMVNIHSKTDVLDVAVYNVMGQLLYQNNEAGLDKNIDISSFAEGTYFFKLKFEDNKDAVFRVIKK